MPRIKFGVTIHILRIEKKKKKRKKNWIPSALEKNDTNFFPNRIIEISLLRCSVGGGKGSMGVIDSV